MPISQTTFTPVLARGFIFTLADTFTQNAGMVTEIAISSIIVYNEVFLERYSRKYPTLTLFVKNIPTRTRHVNGEK